MPKFIYTAKSFDGQAKGGEISAKDEKMAAQQLRSEGFLLTSIKQIEENEVKTKVKFMDRFSTVPLKEKMIFSRNLSVMIASGLTISRSIQNLGAQTKNKKFKQVLNIIYNNIQTGKSFSEALAQHPSIFNDLFVNMVRVGETGGNLEEVLKIVANQMESEHELLSKVRGALMYPAVIVVAMIGIGVIMLTYILPKLMGVFKDMNVDLPPTTKFIIALSDFMSNNKIIVGVSLALIAIFLKVFLGTKLGKRCSSFIFINLPMIKNISIKVNCARFARIYSSLLKSGVPVIEALRIASNTLTNYYYRNALQNGIDKVQKGITLSKVLSTYPNIFPTMVVQMLQVGEETGKVENVLLKLSEFYEEEVSQTTKNLSSIIEPVLMILIGGSVGFFAVSMLQPMYSLMDSIK
jgi:type IV pilus assembly protein PilC